MIRLKDLYAAQSGDFLIIVALPFSSQSYAALKAQGIGIGSVIQIEVVFDGTILGKRMDGTGFSWCAEAFEANPNYWLEAYPTCKDCNGSGVIELPEWTDKNGTMFYSEDCIACSGQGFMRPKEAHTVGEG
jgi:hypothetical protein